MRSRPLYPAVLGCVFVLCCTDGLAKTRPMNLTGLCAAHKAGTLEQMFRGSGHYRQFRWTACPDAYVVQPDAKKRLPLWVGVHRFFLWPAKSLCRKLEIINQGTAWVLCPRGPHHGSIYNYRKFPSSKHVDQWSDEGQRQLRQRFGDRLQKGIALLVGEMEGAILASRMAGRNPERYPRLLLFVADNGIRIWSVKDATAFANNGGKAVYYVVRSCKRNGQCRKSKHLCTELSSHGVACKIIGIPFARPITPKVVRTLRRLLLSNKAMGRQE